MTCFILNFKHYKT